jgi:hypothetical protein
MWASIPLRIQKFFSFWRDLPMELSLGTRRTPGAFRRHRYRIPGPHVTFVGRLAKYRYYNMDQVTGAALKAARQILAIGSG